MYDNKKNETRVNLVSFFLLDIAAYKILCREESLTTLAEAQPTRHNLRICYA